MNTTEINMYLYIKDRYMGPLTINQVKALFETGQIDRSTLLWYEGLTSWITLGDIPGFDRRAPVTIAQPLQIILPDYFLLMVKGNQLVIKKTDFQSQVQAHAIRRADSVYDLKHSRWVRLDQFEETREYFPAPALPSTKPINFLRNLLSIFKKN